MKHNYLIEKRNVLNEMRCNSMTLQEIRFFTIYLSKINARNIDTRSVELKLVDFCKIMDIGRVRIEDVRATTTRLLQKVITIREEDDQAYTSFQLFKQCKVLQNKHEEWIVQIDAHDEALPLLFEFKERYFTYELWNVLKLKSSNQLRMYEVLKQYEKIGKRLLTIEEIKSLLGIDADEYERFYDFKRYVLEPCKKALLECTDICYEYEPIKRGRKFESILFTIEKNESYVNPICLDEFLTPKELSLPEEPEQEEKVLSDCHELLAEATDHEFTEEQIDVIFNHICILPIEKVYGSLDIGRFHYMKRKYAELNERNTGIEIKNRYAYFLKMIVGSSVF